jgi:hypothetical protein
MHENLEDERDHVSERPIIPGELASALRGLRLLGDDPFLSMQATNIDVVDSLCMALEQQTLQALINEERTPSETILLNAQTQMWIFGAYEVLRTWRDRSKKVLKWAKNGGLPARIAHLRRNVGFRHYAQEMQALQLEEVLEDKEAVTIIETDLRRSHIVFRRIEALRIAFAKHEVAGKQNSVAFAPGYGRIDQWTGSLSYEISVGRAILDYVTRRDIANDLRAIALLPAPPQETLDAFDTFMQGPGDEDSFESGSPPFVL